MKPLNVDILDITYHRPGITKVKFLASYGHFLRRGTMVYDTIKGHFLSHNADINLLDCICVALQNRNYSKSI